MGRVPGDAGALHSQDAREKLILDLQPVVVSTARILARRLPRWIEIEELIGIGQLGLIAAVDSFDPSKGLPLKVWAHYKVRGAILDASKRRNYDWELHEELAEEPGSPHPFDPGAAILAAERRKLLKWLLDRLPKAQRTAVRRSYLRGETLAQAGEQIGVKTTRCCVIRQQALAEIRKRLEKRGLGPKELL